MEQLVALIRLAIDAYIIIIIVRAVLSWFNVDYRNPLVRFIHRITDPVLEPIRSTLGMTGPVDFSPLVAILLLYVLEWALLRVLGA
jgi:YggT family protein